VETALEDPLRLLRPHLLLPLAVVRAAPTKKYKFDNRSQKNSHSCASLSLCLNQESYHAKTKCCGPAWFQCGSGSRVLMTKICTILQLKNFLFFDQNLQFFIGPMKDVQATGEDFSPQKRTSRREKMKYFLFLWVYFALLDPADQNQCGFIRIQIHISAKLQQTFYFLSTSPGPQSRQNAKPFLQSSELGPPPPHPLAPLRFRGGGTLASG
jgi:hypothetical protein